MSTKERRYSPDIAGCKANYDWPVRFDLSADGFLGITQEADRIERILMSPKQVKALKAFLAGRLR